MALVTPFQVISSTQAVNLILQPKTSTATDFLAIWGALLATGNVVWTVFRDRGDRGKIRLTAMVGKIVGGPAILEDKKDYVLLTITNIGKRPIKITHVGGRFRRGTQHRSNFLAVGQTYPKL